jgi:hypothetical protein
MLIANIAVQKTAHASPASRLFYGDQTAKER